MIKIYKDTDIYIDDERTNILITRGFWNFSQICLDLHDVKEKDDIISIFEKLNKEGCLDDTKLNSDIQENFDQIIKSGLLYKTNCTSSKCNSNKLLFLTDNVVFVEDKIKKSSNKNKIDVLNINDFINTYLENKKREDIKQNPLEEQKIKQTVQKILIDNNYEVIIVFLTKINHDFCSILNSVIPNKEIIYCLFDKDFTYIFGSKIDYTGCYACFSKRMFSKMKMNRKNYPTQKIRLGDFKGIKPYLIDFAFSLLEYNIDEYFETNVLPITGRIAAIFNSTLEIRYENLLRLSFCPECGYIGRLENKERNMKFKNFLKEVSSNA